MANLTRYKQKIFANNSNQVGVFGTGTDKVASKNVETLQSADYEDGWSSAIVTNKNYPVWQERDGVDYGFSYQLAYLLQKGIPEWLSTETYYQNDYCKVGNVIYYSLQDNNVGHNPSNTSGYWSIFASSSRNIGEIVASTIPLTDAGLHLLDGTLLSGDGSYAQFIDYIADLYDSGDYPDLFDTEANWQSAVTNYGVCGKFVYDSVNNTVRLPKITGIIEGTTDLTALGDLIEAGLPNITGNGKWIHESGTGTGAFYSETGNLNQQAAGSGGEAFNKVYFDASRSSSIYGNSSTVQPQTIKVLYYIVIATSTKTQIQVDIDEIVTDLNGKADVDLTNINASCAPIDGQWVGSNLTLINTDTSITSGTTSTFSLSSYLPNDGYKYEVMLSVIGCSAATSGNTFKLCVGSSIIDVNNNIVAAAIARSNATYWCANNTIIPIGTDRNVYLKNVATHNGTVFAFYASGYRRIGTNA